MSLAIHPTSGIRPVLPPAPSAWRDYAVQLDANNQNHRQLFRLQLSRQNVSVAESGVTSRPPLLSTLSSPRDSSAVRNPRDINAASIARPSSALTMGQVGSAKVWAIDSE